MPGRYQRVEPTPRTITCDFPGCTTTFTTTLSFRKKCDAHKNRQRDERQGPNQRYKKVDPATHPRKTRRSKTGGILVNTPPGNRGNPLGRVRKEIRDMLRDITGVAGDELLRRLLDPKKLAKYSDSDLRQIMNDAARYGIGMPQTKVQVSGTGEDGEIPIAVIGPRPMQQIPSAPVQGIITSAAIAALNAGREEEPEG